MRSSARLSILSVLLLCVAGAPACTADMDDSSAPDDTAAAASSEVVGAREQGPSAAHEMDTIPSWATPENYLGPVDPDEPLSFDIVLRARDQQAAGADREDGAELGAAPIQVEDAAPEDVEAVRAHVAKHGGEVAVNEGRLGVHLRVSGATRIFEEALSMSLARYLVDGKVRHAPSGPIHPPGHLEGRIVGTSGLVE
jgi:hypothetical protein